MKRNGAIASVNLEHRIFLLFICVGLIFLLVVTYLLWVSKIKWIVIFTLMPALVILWLFSAFYARQLLAQHFHGLANVVESIRTGNYNIRTTNNKSPSAWSEIYRELNLLADGQQSDQLEELETDILLDKLLAEFDIPVFVFDSHNILRNCNDKGNQLFLKSKHSLLGMNTKQMLIDSILELPSGAVVEHWFPRQGGRWELRKNYFIQRGQRYLLVLVNDLSRTLREEERNAWTRLIRVLGHELNNSLASMISVSETLISRLHNEKTEAWLKQYDKALHLIHERCASLRRFSNAYTRLAKLPTPLKKTTDLLCVFESLSKLVDGCFVIQNDTTLELSVDPDQIEQLFINLMKNAVEASSLKSPVRIQWQEYQQGVRIQVIDQGTGLTNSENLFVPFYTTKLDGNGIGLFLCRQIAEAHNGTLRLMNRTDQEGCVAECWLPFGLKVEETKISSQLPHD